MIGNDRSVNRFLEQIKGNLDDQQEQKQEQAPSNVVINRAVRCTIIVGQVPESLRLTPGRRTGRKG